MGDQLPEISRPLLLVTGMSGAGKSQALKALEDTGYEVMDNVPLRFVTPLVSQPAAALPSNHAPSQGLVLGMDVRSRDFTPENFLQLVQRLQQMPSVSPHVIFMDCDDEILRRRFTETRRKHPLAVDRPVMDGIRVERRYLEPVRTQASMILDTSDLAPNALKELLRQRFGEASQVLTLQLVSFSFRKGLPRDADLVFDARFLRNPYYDASLKAFTGQHPEVARYIEEDSAFNPFFAQLSSMLLPLLPRYLAEGKSYLTIAIGCTGGKHRSVHVAEKLAGFLENNGYKTTIRHRDMAAHPA